MTKFSNDPTTLVTTAIAGGWPYAPFVGVLIEQGVPVLDRDLNLRADLAAEVFRARIREHIGSGTPSGAADQFLFGATTPVSNDFLLTPGTLLVDGVEVSFAGAPIKYSDQAALHPELANTPLALAPLTVPVGQRFDCVYVDVWFDEIDSTVDPLLFHADEYEIETSIRLKPKWVVRVREGSDSLVGFTGLLGHRYYALGYIQRNGATITQAMINDRRVVDLGLVSQANQINDALETRKNLHSWLAPHFLAEPYSSPSAHVGMHMQVFGNNLDLGSVRVEFGMMPAQALDVVPDDEPVRSLGKQPQTRMPAKGRPIAQSKFQLSTVTQVVVAAPATSWQILQAALEPPVLTALLATELEFVDAKVVGDPQTDVLTIEVPQEAHGYTFVKVTNELGSAIVHRALFVYGPPVWGPPGQQFATYQHRPAYTNGKLALLGANFNLPGTEVEVSGNGVDWGPATVVDSTPLGCVVTAQGWAGEYWYRVKNFASPDFVQSTDSIKVVKP